MRPKAAARLVGLREAATDPYRNLGTSPDLPEDPRRALIGAEFDKGKPAVRLGRKATGPRFLREEMDVSPKDPRSPGC